MEKRENSKKYDLEDRTFIFAKDTRSFIKKVPKTLTNIEDSKQLARSSGSVGANYIEANELFSRKDYFMRVKISRKEAKESHYWLKLLDIDSKYLDKERERLITEAIELTKIFGAIVEKSK